MAKDWYELTRMTEGAALLVERVSLVGKDIAVEGQFELPPLANLSAEDQVFVAAFVRSHGSIKQMEQMFGVSYPTIKNRLNRIGEQLDFVQINAPSPTIDVLDQLESGAISVNEALEMMKK